MEGDTNSKVTIECTDPFNLLAAFEPLLYERLPLRNLHWKSPTRPLRSINVLNVALSKSEKQDRTVNGNVRRHQIPGLRQTPYVKAYLLRCDDNETYRETGRKQIREWIKTTLPPSEGKKSANNQEKHDAFEWLIIHIVLPDTPAAQQPRFKKPHTLGTTDSSDSLDTKSKWPGKGSSTLYEKLKADFNTSKSVIDHVAQVRPSQGTSRQTATVLTPVEVEEQWQDLIETLKVSILSSFTTRVAQYEEDIRERNNQRSLPGWNFCTFFVLKEGLARGFENVGLLEDALAGYDELAAGLEEVMKDGTVGPDNDEATLLPFSRDAKTKIRVALDQLASKRNMTETPRNRRLPLDILDWVESDLFPFSTGAKEYQQNILRNEISASDFQIYIYSRQLEILRRRSSNFTTTWTSKPMPDRPPSVTATDENLAALAEIGRRGIGFINTCARMNRQDLYRAWGGQEGLSGDDSKTQTLVIGNIVASWTWCAIFQLLDMTHSQILLTSEILPVLPKVANISPTAQDAKSNDAEKEQERRKSSDSTAHGARASLDMFVLESTIGRSSASLIPLRGKETTTEVPAPANSGMVQLAAWRAQLLLMARDTMTRLALNDDVIGKMVDTEATAGHPEAGIDAWILKNIVSSPHFFNEVYEHLTKIASRHFMLSRKVKSAEKAVLDLALVKYESSDYLSALTYFDAVKTFYQGGTWPKLTLLVMHAYADCLKRLERQQEYVQCLLSILSVSMVSHSLLQNSNAQSEQTQEQLDELLSLSRQAESLVAVPFSSIVELVHIDDYIQHFSNKDGFLISVSLSLRLHGYIVFDEGCTLTLEAVADAVPSMIAMKSSHFLKLTRASTSMLFSSNITTCGWYKIAKIELRIGNLLFTTDSSVLKMVSLAEPRNISQTFLVYPRAAAMQVKAKTHRLIDLRKTRSLLLEVSCGENTIKSASIALKSATAGLRLHLHEAKICTDLGDHACFDSDDNNQQALVLNDMTNQNILDVSIPYTLENGDTTIDITADVTYETANGMLKYYEKLNVNTILPVSVNVQDAFKRNQLFWRFTVSPATLVPVQVESCNMLGAEKYHLVSGMTIVQPLDIFPRQPASFTVCFTPREDLTRKDRGDMSLQILYRCIDEIVLSALENRFVQEIESSDIRLLTRLLSSHLIRSYRTKWTEGDLETASLFHKVEVWPYEEFDWDTILCGLKCSQQVEARTWLRAWHERCQVIPFLTATAPLRQITIPVDIPTPVAVVEADLQLSKSTGPLTLGKPVTATVTLSWTDAWADEQIRSKRHTILLSVDLSAPVENWLLAGQKRLNFLARPDERHEFPILLIPQRVGHLLYPTVEVRCFRSVETDDSEKKEHEMPCEVAYMGLALGVRVTPDWEATTVAIDGEEEGGGVSNAWLVGAQGSKQKTGGMIGVTIDCYE